MLTETLPIKPPTEIRKRQTRRPRSTELPSPPEGPFAEAPHIDALVEEFSALFPENDYFRKGAELSYQYDQSDPQPEKPVISPETIAIFKGILNAAERSADLRKYHTQWYVDLLDNNRVFRKLEPGEDVKLKRDVLKDSLSIDPEQNLQLTRIFSKFEDESLRLGAALIPTLNAVEVARINGEFDTTENVSYPTPLSELQLGQPQTLRTAV